MREAIIKYWPEAAGTKPEMPDFGDAAKVAEMARRIQQARIDLPVHRNDPAGKTIADIFEAVAEEHLFEPTILYDFPLAISPLSKDKRDEPDWVERFEIYVAGMEIGNAFSELNDPEEQRRRFEQQLGQRELGDEEAHRMDEDYIRALSYGMPPTGGEGTRHRSDYHAAYRLKIDPGRDPLPAAASGKDGGAGRLRCRKSSNRFLSERSARKIYAFDSQCIDPSLRSGRHPEACAENIRDAQLANYYAAHWAAFRRETAAQSFRNSSTVAAAHSGSLM